MKLRTISRGPCKQSHSEESHSLSGCHTCSGHSKNPEACMFEESSRVLCHFANPDNDRLKQEKNLHPKSDSSEVMARLESLPDELHLMIWDAIQRFQPDDIANYALACPHIRALATSILKENRWLKKHLTSVINYQSTLEGEHEKAQHIKTFHLLEIVTINPTHGLYVKKLTIGDGDSRSSFETERQFWQYWRIPGRIWASVAAHPHFIYYPEWTLPLPEQAVKDSEYLDANADSSWVARMKLSHCGPCLAFLLTLLPNLTSLVVNQNGANDNWFLEFIEDITRSPNPTVLSNLISVDISGIQRHDEQTPWKVLRVFFNIPSLKKLKACRLKDATSDAGREIKKFSHERNSNVTDLDLQNCDLNEGSLGQVLSLFKSLESFTYSWRCSRVTRVEDRCVPIAVRCADLNHNQFHLTKFDLKRGSFIHLVVVKYSKIQYPLVRRGLPLTDALPFSRGNFHMHNEFHWPILEENGMVDGSERVSGY